MRAHAEDEVAEVQGRHLGGLGSPVLQGWADREGLALDGRARGRYRVGEEWAPLVLAEVLCLDKGPERSTRAALAAGA